MLGFIGYLVRVRIRVRVGDRVRVGVKDILLWAIWL